MIIAGRLRTDAWEKDAVKCSKLKVAPDLLRFIGREQMPQKPPAGPDERTQPSEDTQNETESPS